MKRFASLFAAIDQTTSTNAKVEAMVAYFATAPAGDAAWAVFFLTGRRLKRLVAGMAVANGRSPRRGSASGCSANAMPWSATARRRRR